MTRMNWNVIFILYRVVHSVTEGMCRVIDVVPFMRVFEGITIAVKE